MRWLKTTVNIFLTMVVILVLVLGAGYIGLSLYDWNNLKPRISKALEDATGRDVTIQGDVAMELDLSPTLGINDIQVQNAKWGSSPNMLTISRAELEISLFSLLDERTEIRRIFLRNPDLNLETSEEGELNWQPVSKEKKKDQPPSNFFGKVRVENGAFSYQDHAMDKTFQGELEYLSATADAFDSPVQVDAIGTYAGRDLSINGDIGSQAGMLIRENEWRVDLKAELGDAQANIDGVIPFNSTVEAGQLKIFAEGDNLSQLAALFGVSVPTINAFQVNGKIAKEAAAKRWQITGEAILEEMTFKTDGSMAELTSLEELQAEISAEGPNLSRLAALAGQSLPIDTSFDVTADIAHTRETDRWSVSGKGQLAEIGFSVDGSVPDLASLDGIRTNFSMEGPDYSSLMALFGISVPVESPFEISGELTDSGPDQFLKGDMNASIGEMALEFEVQMPGLTEVEGLEGSISAKGSDFSKFLALFAVSSPVGKDFDIETRLAIPEASTYRLDEIRARIGESDFSGTIRIDAGAEPFAVAIQGTSDQLQLATYFDQERPAEPEAAKGEPEGGTEQVFPDRPLPVQLLEAVNADVDLEAGNLILPNLYLTDFTMEMSLQGGHLQISTFQGQVGSGTVAGRMEVRSDADPPAVTAALNADDIQLNKLLPGGDPVQKLQGTVNFSLDISGEGATYAELAADLAGKAELTMADGTLYYRFIRILGYNVFSALIDVLNPFDEDRELVDINCMVIRFDIEDGLAESTAMILDTPEVAIIGDGKINLRTEEIDIPLNTIPKKNIGIKNVVGLNVSLSKFIDPLQIDGTLSNPTVRLDVPGSLFSIGKAIGGVALFGPAGIAATLFSGGVGKQDRCQAALEKKDGSEE